MSNWIKRAAAAIGRFTGFGGRDSSALASFDCSDRHHDALIERVGVIGDHASPRSNSADDLNALLEAVDAPTMAGDVSNDASQSQRTPWGEAIPAAPAGQAPADSELALEAIAELAEPAITGNAAIPMAEVPTAPEASGERALDAEPVLESVRIFRPTAEMKPERSSSAPEIKPEPAKPSLSFNQLYDLISGEVHKQTDATVGVYERLLTTTREELAVTRRSTKIAWGVGATMALVAAVGTFWTLGEVTGTKSAVIAIRSQVSTGVQAVAERDQLRVDLHRAKEDGKIEVGAIKSRLDQALLVTAERDRLKLDLEATRRAKLAAESELQIARATAAATTQPLSSARPADAVQTTLLSDRIVENSSVATATSKTIAPSKVSPEKRAANADRWSMLLNGQE